MPTVAPQRRFLSPQDYLTIEREAEIKSEYADGEVFAMSGGSLPHNLISGNLNRMIGNQLKGRPCLALNSDMKIWIAEANKFAYPDMSALCGEAEFFDENQDVITNPSFIAEVLSPSTEAYDRGGKFRKYGRIKTLQEYLLVSQDRMLAELYQRQDDGTWNLRIIDGAEDRFKLPSIQCELTLQDLYDKVRFREGDS